MQDIARLLEQATPGLFRTMFATAAGTGMRSEELCALAVGQRRIGSRTVIRAPLSQLARDQGQTGPCCRGSIHRKPRPATARYR